MLALLATIAVRAPDLDREITHDEAYSWLGFASLSYEQIFTTYHLPNNHILHSDLMRLSSQVFGGTQEWMLRAPAFVAGVAAVPVMAGLAASALGSPATGVVAA
jgi:4-amino-4-deoxy-L-arabinose transferase-like glycosyltransferase